MSELKSVKKTTKECCKFVIWLQTVTNFTANSRKGLGAKKIHFKTFPHLQIFHWHCEYLRAKQWIKCIAVFLLLSTFCQQMIQSCGFWLKCTMYNVHNANPLQCTCNIEHLHNALTDIWIGVFLYSSLSLYISLYLLFRGILEFMHIVNWVIRANKLVRSLIFCCEHDSTVYPVK